MTETQCDAKEPVNTHEETTELQDVTTRDSEENSSEVNVESMRKAFYETALNLFGAAKALKPFDVLYTDGLLAQAQYFVTLADNHDTLNAIAKISRDMPLSKFQSRIPSNMVNKIDEYANAISDRLNNSTNKAEVSDEVMANISKITQAIKEKME